MKRLAQLMLFAGIVVVAVTGAVAPATASGARALPTGVNDFVFESFEGDYYLDTDEDGRSTLRTVEKFVAVFPDFDQNRGILRAFVDDYDGHPLDIEVVSVTDENGDPRDWHFADEDEGSGDDRFLEIVIRDDDPNVYVHGRQTYVITYDQHNVTRYFPDTDVEEFYWDTNGTGWYQPFGSVTARLHVPADLADSLTGDAACYFGIEGSNQQCTITETDEEGGTLFTASVSDVQPTQNMTIAIAFENGTFVDRDDSYFASFLGWFQAILLAGAVAVAIWAIMLRRTVLKDGEGRPTIIAEYAPPKYANVLTSAVVLRKTTRASAAMFIDLAVGRNIRIIESPASGWFSRKPTYTFELLGTDGLDDQEQQLAAALFGRQLRPGSQYTMTSKDVSLSKRVLALVTSARKRAVADGWRKKVSIAVSIFPTMLVVLAAIGVFVTGIIMMEQDYGGALPLVFVAPGLVCVLIVFVCVFRVPLTTSGAELRDHLKGLEIYIKLAEADRLRVLQSPEGAERTPVAADDPGEVLKLYEKLLPYAVLFNLETRWAEELGRYYTDSSPDWYSGSGAFNAGIFAASIGSLSTVASTSYSGSSSSSSSGGSGGGGSSGGGGGGGGGGGV